MVVWCSIFGLDQEISQGQSAHQTHCSSNDALPQHRSVLRAIHTLNPPKKINRMLRVLSTIHLMHWPGAQGLMWGTRGPFLPVAAMVGLVLLVAKQLKSQMPHQYVNQREVHKMCTGRGWVWN